MLVFWVDLKTTKGHFEINQPLKAIVNVSSIAGLRASTGSLAYKISKAAMDQLTRCSALELAPKAQYIHYDSKLLALVHLINFPETETFFSIVSIIFHVFLLLRGILVFEHLKLNTDLQK